LPQAGYRRSEEDKMKLIGLVTAILSVLCVPSHGQDASAPASIIGTWQMETAQKTDGSMFPIQSFTITFTGSNTFLAMAEIENEGKRMSTNRTGTYKLQGKQLTTYTAEENLEEEYIVEMQGARILLALPGYVTLTLNKKEDTPNKEPEDRAGKFADPQH